MYILHSTINLQLITWVLGLGSWDTGRGPAGRRKDMEITVNGEERKLSGPMTISGLLKELAIDPETVVVERNLKILSLEDHEGQTLDTGDNIEIIQLVDGG